MSTSPWPPAMPDDRRVVAVVQADDQLGVRRRRTGRRQPGDHGLQLAGRDLAGAAAAVRVLGEPDRGGRGGHGTNLGARQSARPPGSTTSRGRLLAASGRAARGPPGASGGRAEPAGAPNVGRVAPRRGLAGQLGALDAVEPEPPDRLPLPAPGHEVLVVGGAGEQLRLHLAPAGRALAVAVVEDDDPVLRQGPARAPTALRAARPASSADEQGARQQRLPAPRVGLQGREHLVQRPAALGRVRARRAARRARRRSPLPARA